MIIGFDGRNRATILLVGRADRAGRSSSSRRAWPGWCPSCSRRGRSSRRRRRPDRASEAARCAAGTRRSGTRPRSRWWRRRGEDVVDVAPGRDVFARLVAVDALAPREPVAVHLPVEAEEERVAPGLRGRGEAADVGVVAAGDDVGELEVRLVRCSTGSTASPAEERDRAVLPDVFHRVGAEMRRRSRATRAVGERLEEVDHRDASSARTSSNLRHGVHVPGRLRRRSAGSRSGAPVDRWPGPGPASGSRPVRVRGSGRSVPVGRSAALADVHGHLRRRAGHLTRRRWRSGCETGAAGRVDGRRRRRGAGCVDSGRRCCRR